MTTNAGSFTLADALREVASATNQVMFMVGFREVPDDVQVMLTRDLLDPDEFDRRGDQRRQRRSARTHSRLQERAHARDRARYLPSTNTELLTIGSCHLTVERNPECR